VPKIPKIEDHRVRVAAERRERTRKRLLEAALVVFSQHGVEGSVVDEVTTIAGVARGTFYNYFRTNEELLSTVATEATNEVVNAIEARFDEPPDGPPRIAAGIRSWLELVQRYPHVGAFFRRAGLYTLDLNVRSRILARDYMPRWVASGKLNLKCPELLWDIVSGSILAGINTIVLTGAPKDYAEEMTLRVLVALGVDFEEAASVAFAPLEPLVLPPDSLIERSVARFETLRTAAQ